MIRGGAAALGGLALLLVGACSFDTRDTPSTGPGPGPVEVRPSVTPTPGATLAVVLDSDDDDRGSACLTLDEWTDDGWRARWYWVRPEAPPVAIPDDGQATCPLGPAPLPDERTVLVPEPLAEGTWRLAYVAGEDDVGAYVFDVE